VEKLMELREPGTDSAESLVDQVYEILRGIEDEDNVVFHIDETDGTVDESGWWETSEGAEFGARKLSEIVDLVSEAEAEIRMWKEKVIEWQDVDSSNQEEIERLKDEVKRLTLKEFVDVDEIPQWDKSDISNKEPVLYAEIERLNRQLSCTYTHPFPGEGYTCGKCGFSRDERKRDSKIDIAYPPEY